MGMQGSAGRQDRLCRRHGVVRRRGDRHGSGAAPAATFIVTFNGMANWAAIEALIENLTGCL